MKIKLSNYISEFLVNAGITDMFTVTGGGAMHLNDAFGHQKGLRCIYNHHEQACAIAAESYARMHNKIAAVCVTTGPGGTNAITGVLGGYLDSIPMLIISGQVRYDTTVRSTGLPLRAMGDQEFDIVQSISCMTKYSEMVIDPLRIKYALEKALYLAQTGRPGPCWLDIPVNVQGSYIETDDLVGYNPEEEQQVPKVERKTVLEIIERIKTAKRPILYAGSAIRIAGAYEIFKSVASKLNIPIVTGWNSIDLVYDEHPLYVGRGGIMGDRAGNFAVQNSDLILSIGNRLSIRQVGYNFKTWAREAYTIVNDIDEYELQKPTIHVSMPIHADAKDLLKNLDKELSNDKLFTGKEWLEVCNNWKNKYPVMKPEYMKDTAKGKVNVYGFVKVLGDIVSEGSTVVVGNGSACVVGSHGYRIKKNQRFIINSGVASMGYCLPAAIGACVANDGKSVILISGDGSVQMNLQELQTIIHHRMPIKVFVINNEGYHSIRQTQTNYFGEPLVGVGNDSGDLSFPDLKKLAPAYGFPFMRIENMENIQKDIQKVVDADTPYICEIMVDKEQKFEPKAAAKRLPDGTMISAPLEDLAPFLPKEELKSIMFIPMVDEY
jgi:Thiamine pyrophosphate-requiring enzymes [acetolactate synthase, pyruvate dehydrogenase (cytochrome), glyoxylate carboligase, phosphonopyruvate decarboxylase]